MPRADGSGGGGWAASALGGVLLEGAAASAVPLLGASVEVTAAAPGPDDEIYAWLARHGLEAYHASLAAMGYYEWAHVANMESTEVELVIEQTNMPWEAARAFMHACSEVGVGHGAHPSAAAAAAVAQPAPAGEDTTSRGLVDLRDLRDEPAVVVQASLAEPASADAADEAMVVVTAVATPAVPAHSGARAGDGAALAALAAAGFVTPELFDPSRRWSTRSGVFASPGDKFRVAHEAGAELSPDADVYLTGAHSAGAVRRGTIVDLVGWGRDSAGRIRVAVVAPKPPFFTEQATGWVSLVADDGTPLLAPTEQTGQDIAARRQDPGFQPAELPAQAAVPVLEPLFPPPPLRSRGSERLESLADLLDGRQDLARRRQDLREADRQCERWALMEVRGCGVVIFLVLLYHLILFATQH